MWGGKLYNQPNRTYFRCKALLPNDIKREINIYIYIGMPNQLKKKNCSYGKQTSDKKNMIIHKQMPRRRRRRKWEEKKQKIRNHQSYHCPDTKIKK